MLLSRDLRETDSRVLTVATRSARDPQPSRPRAIKMCIAVGADGRQR